jgi:hypothetical protein
VGLEPRRAEVRVPKRRSFPGSRTGPRRDARSDQASDLEAARRRTVALRHGEQSRGRRTASLLRPLPKSKRLDICSRRRGSWVWCPPDSARPIGCAAARVRNGLLAGISMRPRGVEPPRPVRGARPSPQRSRSSPLGAPWSSGLSASEVGSVLLSSVPALVPASGSAPSSARLDYANLSRSRLARSSVYQRSHHATSPAAGGRRSGWAPAAASGDARSGRLVSRQRYSAAAEGNRQRPRRE